ncbi:MAG: AAA family ATPase [Acidobacteriota bacterium]|nr:AAA family ATPase [Acidobacteriota bacterium]
MGTDPLLETLDLGKGAALFAAIIPYKANQEFLPIGIQTFRDIRTNDFVYVDKTALIHELVRPYFLRNFAGRFLCQYPL